MLKKIDFLSPPITLFYNGSPSHPSYISGILTLLTLVLVIFFCSYQIKVLFNRKNETPKTTSFTYFQSDAGTISLNNSALFHFISLEDKTNKGNEEFYFSYFNIIGAEEPIHNYDTGYSIYNYNHWLYGYCDDSIIGDLKDIFSKNIFLSKSACIKKYYDINSKQYYNTESPHFRWPSISHGTFHPDNKIYSLAIVPCNPNFSDILFNKELICKNSEEFNFSTTAIHLNFIDEYIDILKYDNPVVKYAYRIENKFDKNNYGINHLNFNPAQVKSYFGYIFDEEEIGFSFSFERNDVYTYPKDIDLYMGYTFYLNNRINYFERSYIKIQDILSSVGGVLNIIIFIMTFINNLLNAFSALRDFNCLMNLFSITTDDILKTNKKNILNKKLKIIENCKKNSCSQANPSSNEKIIQEILKEESKEEDKDTMSNKTISTEKNENNDIPKITAQTETSFTNNENKGDSKAKPENENDKSIHENLTISSFSNYFIYKITCGKKHNNIEIYENFRKKIVSVEHLMHSYLKINDLLKLEKRRSNQSNKF